MQQPIGSSGIYPTVPELSKSEFLVKGCKPDSATHGTKNMIANRLRAVLGKRQRLAVLRLTVNQFPSGKHWRFNSSLPHARKQDRNL